MPTMPDLARRQPHPPGPDRAWLALGPASRLLGVDPDTLRRWADDGRVEAYLTPGGHRRFERASLERVAAARSGQPRSSFRTLGATPERLSRAYRRCYAATRTAGARPVVAAPEREAYRDDGRRLVEALIAHLDADDPAARRRAEEEALALTDELARRLAAAGTGLPDAVAQFVAARRPLLSEIGSLAARRTLDAASLSALYQAASDLMDRLLMRLVVTHQAAPPESTAPAVPVGSPEAGP